MAFCIQCGSQSDGKFCTKCGAPMGQAAAAAGPAAPQGATLPAPPSAPAAPAASAAPPKKGGALKWILIGCGGLIIIGGLIFAAVTYFAIHKARQAGLDPDLAKRNPALAAAKMMASLNPDIEIVGVNEGRGTITLREKPSGKTVTLNLSDVEKGHISFEGAQGEKVEIRGEGQGGGIQVQTPEGTASFGAGGKLPAWLPAYPGAEQTGVFGAQGKQGESGTVQLKTSDSVDQVASFYEAELRKAGLTPRKNVITQDGRNTLATVIANDSAAKRTANITASATDEGTVVGITFEAKK